MNSNMEKPYVVGIDIGGTNTVFGIVDARGTILPVARLKQPAIRLLQNMLTKYAKTCFR